MAGRFLKPLLKVGQLLCIAVEYHHVNATFFKHYQWLKLVSNLKRIEKKSKTADVEGTIRYFLIGLVFYWVIVVYRCFVWTDILGIDFYRQYFVEILQTFVQFIHMWLLVQILQIITSKYGYIKGILQRSLEHCDNLEARLGKFGGKLTESVLVVKETVDVFNDLFGWPILLSIFTTSLVLMNGLDDVFKNSYFYQDSQIVAVLISNSFEILLSFCIMVVVILSCDAVLTEAAATLALAHNLRRAAIIQGVSGKVKEELGQVIALMVNYEPQFRAAGFFRLRKTTIFHILGTSATYLIVMIQFNASSEENVNELEAMSNATLSKR